MTIWNCEYAGATLAGPASDEVPVTGGNEPTPPPAGSHVVARSRAGEAEDTALMEKHGVVQPITTYVER